MPFTFPYQYGFIDNRKVPYPIVIAELETVRGKRKYSFIMDTGADTLTMPKIMIVLLGIDRKTLGHNKSQGIGKELVRTLEGNIPVTFCGKRFIIRCSFTDNDKTPFLLGKEGIFDAFNVTFDNDRKMTVFEERK